VVPPLLQQRQFKGRKLSGPFNFCGVPAAGFGGLILFTRENSRDFCPERKRSLGDLITAFQYLKGPTGKPERGFLQGPVVTGQGGIALTWKRVGLH